ncbi:MAG: CHASE domain-containing protein, partial [Myxococcota bacterium]
MNYVAGKAALFLAIPPGFATSPWPPAGIALAAVLAFGARVWPGVMLASVLINYDVCRHADGLPPLPSLVCAATIAAGSTAQALVGAAWVRRCVPFPLVLERERDVLMLLALGGPLACLVAPTVAVAALSSFGLVTVERIPLTWFTWWAGDVIGVIILTPVALSFLAEPREVWRPRRLRVAVPLLVAFAGTTCVTAFSRFHDEQAAHARFQLQARELSDVIQEQLDRDLETTYALRSFFLASEHVTQAEFRLFTDCMLQRHPGILALGWLPRVPASERAAFELEARRDGLPDFQITELNDAHTLVSAGARPEFLPLRYVEPLHGNLRAPGLDVAALREPRAALLRASSAGE